VQCWGELAEEYGENPGKIDALCRFGKVNFANIAREMGCFGIRVERPEKIAGAIKKALDSNLPAVVEVITDIKSITPQPWSPPINI
jgi:acetolactate synthase-1/2/3 large subunit